MIRFLLYAGILHTAFIFTHAQEHYYWARGKKYTLELYSEKQYVLVHGPNIEAITQGLDLSEQNIISELQPIKVSETIKVNRKIASGNDNLHWVFVNRSVDKSKIMSSDILYTAPSFLVNGKEVSLSQYFYVKLNHENDVLLLENLAKENKVEIVGNDTFMPLWYILSCDKNSSGNALEVANLFYETGNFASAQPDLMEDLNVSCTNDPMFNQQWHLNNTGQSGGTVGNDIKACQAWNITTGCANVIVAVLDHGLEFNHPDFANISTISFDTETGTSPSIVRGNHGVAVAGVIAATANNGIGVAGVAPNVQLMSISSSLVLAPLFSQRLSDGINFAWQNGASVINNSWGHNSITQQELIADAIDIAVTQGRNGLGTIVVFASGNDSNNSIIFPSDNPLVISVGAIGRNPSRASFSNYGPGLDVVAPGVSIRTTDRQGALGYNQNGGAAGNYTSLDGTSFAAPQVAGIAALILSINPDLTLQQVRHLIESTADKAGNYTYTLGSGEQSGLSWNTQMGYGRVNAFKALQTVFSTTGPTVLCTSAQGTYTLSNVPVGASVSWNTSTNLSIVSGQSTNQLTVQGGSSGAGWVMPTITGECVAVELAKFAISVDKPFWDDVSLFNGYDGGSYWCTTFTGNGFNLQATNDLASHQFRIKTLGGSLLYTSGVNYGTTTPNVYYYPAQGWYILETRATNSCGTTDWVTSYVEVVDCQYGGGGGGGEEEQLTLYPNPSNSDVIISSKSRQPFQVWVYNASNDIVFTGKATNGVLRKQLVGLPKGIYVVVSHMADGTQHQARLVKN